VPEIKAYWKTSWTSNPDPSHPEKKINKILLLLNLLLSEFQGYFYPSQNPSADETMMGFHGRFGSTQYTPKKPVKWGIKAIHTS